MEPYFRYSCSEWGAAGINAINRLQKLKNRVARMKNENILEGFFLQPEGIDFLLIMHAFLSFVFVCTAHCKLII